MIVVKLSGGLGNQMFQYAAGLSVVVRLKTKLKLDVSGFVNEGVTRREYQLGVFNVRTGLATEEEINNLIIQKGRILTLFPRVISAIEPLLGLSHIVERINKKSLSDVPNNSYMEGYWNSPKFFENLSINLIRKNFSFKKQPNKVNSGILEKINKTNSVSLHIRRSDYVTNQKVNNKFCVCDVSYYYKAIEYIVNKIKSPHFFVFSDDLDWATTNLKFSFPVMFVRNNINVCDAEDFRLMTACKHNIIANSTYSWWAAWLNKNPDKIIIAPQKWYIDVDLNKKYLNDLYPSSWIRI